MPDKHTHIPATELRNGDLMRIGSSTNYVLVHSIEPVTGGIHVRIYDGDDRLSETGGPILTPNTDCALTMRNAAPAPAETMTVTVRDRSREAPWGSGMTNPVTRKVTISAFCPVCGDRRGEPYGNNSCDDGAYYWVQQWNNPCGHVDLYPNVVTEAVALATKLAEAAKTR